ncbi:hypothetical protein [Streptomyces sp. cg35]|uniref:hypothetical protein n=1 Tax=Streptomyces sp. cg35 TaxID=3421650 RepID=UPI003D180EE2
MTDTWTTPLGGTRLEGPVADWQHPDAYWTPEFEATARAKEASGEPVPCPVCTTEVSNVEQDAVYGLRQDMGSVYESHAGTLGWLVTLHPCGHKLAR